MLPQCCHRVATQVDFTFLKLTFKIFENIVKSSIYGHFGHFDKKKRAVKKLPFLVRVAGLEPTAS